ncbi:MAG: hypothetical protein WAW39_10305 [Prosthecobacter sp.]|uniref:hypothetical protein n=1 Tax=Prosthecobacter sp. TaxID=1965333 RepID=UPI003BB0A6B1
MRPLVFLFTLATAALAQSEGDKPMPPPPPPKPGDGPPPYREGEHRGPPGMGRPRGFDGFEKLSEVEKQKVRAAFEKAWQRPEVIESRDRALRANEEMRNTLHNALKEIDPEVVGILEKIKPQFPMDQRGLPEMPKPDSPNFAHMAAIRLGAELQSISRPERRDETRVFHERLLQLPRVKEALARLDTLPTAERMEAFKKFRDIYREAAGQEFMKFRERGGEPKDGFRRPPPEQDKPAPPPGQPKP